MQRERDPLPQLIRPVERVDEEPVLQRIHRVVVALAGRTARAARPYRASSDRAAASDSSISARRTARSGSPRSRPPARARSAPASGRRSPARGTARRPPPMAERLLPCSLPGCAPSRATETAVRSKATEPAASKPKTRRSIASRPLSRRSFMRRSADHSLLQTETPSPTHGNPTRGVRRGSSSSKRWRDHSGARNDAPDGSPQQPHLIALEWGSARFSSRPSTDDASCWLGLGHLPGSGGPGTIPRRKLASPWRFLC